ncbi:amidase [Yoonia sp.]|uniref:amidase n=1 Tax=Yoonia sp. TaxID=2212373 RepID=UPI003A4E1311
MHDETLADLSATDMAFQIRQGTVSSEDLVRACLARIARYDGQIRAFITVDADAALAAARAADRRQADGAVLPMLHGIPVAIKDVTATAGLRTTQGSRIFADHVPEQDATSVARLRAAGAIILGKTNTPEFAFGAVCTNALCGPTATPWDLDRSSGGSSGGSAAAVASGMVPLAQGTDFGGSVRTPASFCGVVGLRPVPGTIAEPERALAEARLATQAVLARTVEDGLLMLRAMAGRHPLDPVSRLQPVIPVPKAVQDLRIAASADLGGAFVIDNDVRARFVDACKAVPAALGRVTQDAPDVGGGVAAFRTLRAAESWWKFRDLVTRHEDQLSPSYVWNVRQGAAISATDLLSAEAARARVWRNFVEFFDRYDILLMPAVSVQPFPNDAGEVTRLGGKPTGSILDYLACTFLISLVGFPCLSLPAPMNGNALPFGLQMICAPGKEAILWAAAQRLAREGFGYVRPPLLTEALT